MCVMELKPVGMDGSKERGEANWTGKLSFIGRNCHAMGCGDTCHIGCLKLGGLRLMD